MSSPSTPPAGAENNAPPAPDAPMVEWALWNARQGFRVFPLKAGTKDKPTVPKLSLATRVEAQIREWWSRPGHEKDNPAGFLPDHVVIDLDRRDKKTGAENDWRPSAKLLKITNEAAASAMRVQTRNGLHLYWRRPAAANIISANGVEPYIDVRALEAQGYLILPAAKVAYTDKEGAKRLYRYKITNLPDEIGELPPQIAEAILARQGLKRKRCESGAIAPGAEIDSDVALALASEAAAAWPPSVEGEGGRTNMLALVMRAGDLGVSPNVCLDVLLVAGGWNERCAPPWEHEELDYQVRTMFASRSMPIGCHQPAVLFAGVSVDPPEVSAPSGVRGPSRRWFDSGDAYDVDEMSWLVDGMLPARGVGIIGGPSQSGKTFLVYALAQCLATGEPFFGHKADELVSTFILQSESYLSGRKRLHAIDRQRGSAEPLPISILDAGGIASHAEQRAIIEMIVVKRDGFVLRGFPRLGLVVLDTLSASRLIAKENGNDEIADGIRFLQTLADPGQSRPYLDPHVPQVPNRADARAHQMRWRVDRAAGQDDLIGAEFLLPPAHHGFDADAALAFEDQAGDGGARRNRQIFAQARARIQIADGGGHPAFIGIGNGDGKISVFPLRVLVRQIFPTRLLEGLSDGFRVFRPQIRKNPADGNAALASMPGALEIHVALDLFEVR